MSYYAGGYYAGGYYRGGIFSSIGRAVKRVLPVVASLIPGVGGIAARVIGGATKVAAIGTGIQIATNAFSGATGGGMVPNPGFKGTMQRFLPGGSTGYHTRRRMNVTNVRALRRAGRRVKGFLKLASRLGALPVNRGKGKTLFKRKARR